MLEIPDTKAEEKRLSSLLFAFNYLSKMSDFYQLNQIGVIEKIINLLLLFPIKLMDNLHNQITRNSFRLSNKIVGYYLSTLFNSQLINNKGSNICYVNSSSSSTSEEIIDENINNWFVDMNNLDIVNISESIYDEDSNKNSNDNNNNFKFIEIIMKENNANEIMIQYLNRFISLLMSKHFCELEKKFVEFDYLMLYCSICIYVIIEKNQNKKNVKKKKSIFSKLFLNSFKLFNNSFYQFCKFMKKKNIQFNNYIFENTNFLKILFMWMSINRKLHVLRDNV
jgi:hypothetical protein